MRSNRCRVHKPQKIEWWVHVRPGFWKWLLKLATSLRVFRFCSSAPDVVSSLLHSSFGKFERPRCPRRFVSRVGLVTLRLSWSSGWSRRVIRSRVISEFVCVTDAHYQPLFEILPIPRGISLFSRLVTTYTHLNMLMEIYCYSGIFAQSESLGRGFFRRNLFRCGVRFSYRFSVLGWSWRPAERSNWSCSQGNF